jgi:hypothetical protein
VRLTIVKPKKQKTPVAVGAEGEEEVSSPEAPPEDKAPAEQ